MNGEIQVSDQEVELAYKKMKLEAEQGGYYLNPDLEFTKALIKGLLVNEKRYGYPVCPCRLSAKNKQKDLDIICPCDYRDPDVVEFGACYCALYVSKAALEGKVKIGAVPERRKKMSGNESVQKPAVALGKDLPLPVWRCKVCGYLCARENPPEICPICKVTKDRFERFI